MSTPATPAPHGNEYARSHSDAPTIAANNAAPATRSSSTTTAHPPTPPWWSCYADDATPYGTPSTMADAPATTEQAAAA